MADNPFEILTNLKPEGPIGRRVYQELKQRILEGHFPPGTPLPEDQLTNALGVSRIPVREALILLKGDGLVQITPRRGARVLKLDLKKIDELLEVREVYETAFFDRAVRSIKHGEFKEIQRKFKLIEEAMDSAKDDIELYRQNHMEYLNIDIAFHMRLVSASGNSIWIKYYTEIINQITLYRHVTPQKDPSFFEDSKKEHHAILDAILAGDFPQAKWLLRQHIRNFRNRLHSNQFF